MAAVQSESEPQVFFFEDQAVGYFEHRSHPLQPGSHRYMPYRGIGHYRLIQSVKSSGPQRCYYLDNDAKQFFTVLNCQPSGIIEVG